MTIWQGKSFGIAGLTIIVSGKLVKVIVTDSEKHTVSTVINNWKMEEDKSKSSINSYYGSSILGNNPPRGYGTYINPNWNVKIPTQIPSITISNEKTVEHHPFDEPIKFLEEVLEYLKKEKMVDKL